jgi:hypothetical protein
MRFIYDLRFAIYERVHASVTPRKSQIVNQVTPSSAAAPLPVVHHPDILPKWEGQILSKPMQKKISHAGQKEYHPWWMKITSHRP